MTSIQVGSFKLGSNSPSATQDNSTLGFSAITFPTPFPKGSKVIVVPMIQTFNGPETPDLRIQNVSRTGFLIRINEVVVYPNKALSNGPHNTETIGWIAFTA